MSMQITRTKINVLDAIGTLQNTSFNRANKRDSEFLKERLADYKESFGGVNRELRWIKQGRKETIREVNALESVKTTVLKMNTYGDENLVVDKAVDRTESKYRWGQLLKNVGLIGGAYAAGYAAIGYLPLSNTGAIITAWTASVLIAIGFIRFIASAIKQPKMIKLFENARAEIKKQLDSVERKD